MLKRYFSVLILALGLLAGCSGSESSDDLAMAVLLASQDRAIGATAKDMAVASTFAAALESKKAVKGVEPGTIDFATWGDEMLGDILEVADAPDGAVAAAIALSEKITQAQIDMADQILSGMAKTPEAQQLVDELMALVNSGVDNRIQLAADLTTYFNDLSGVSADLDLGGNDLGVAALLTSVKEIFVADQNFDLAAFTARMEIEIPAMVADINNMNLDLAEDILMFCVRDEQGRDLTLALLDVARAGCQVDNEFSAATVAYVFAAGTIIKDIAVQPSGADVSVQVEALVALTNEYARTVSDRNMALARIIMVGTIRAFTNNQELITATEEFMQLVDLHRQIPHDVASRIINEMVGKK